MKMCFTLLTILVFLQLTPLYANIQCSKETICIETQEKDKTVRFYAINKKNHKTTLHISVQKSNIKASHPLPMTVVLEAKEKRFIFSLHHGEKAWRYNYSFKWARGNYRAVHDSDYVYALPYAKGDKFKIAQSCNGSFSHFGYSQYAIDFLMPIDTPIHAAREGKVVDLKYDSNVGGKSKSYIDNANYVILEHNDGTLGEYFHLKPKGTTVALGESVNIGDLVGYSGNTGYTDGPHLHFVLKSVDKYGKSFSVPSKFSTQEGIMSCPKENTFPQHYNF